MAKKKEEKVKYKYTMRCGRCNHNWHADKITSCPECGWTHMLLTDHAKLQSRPYEAS